MISYITQSQWEYAQHIGELQQRKAGQYGLADNRAVGNEAGEIHGLGIAGEIAVFNAFGLALPDFSIGESDGGVDLVLPSGIRCQVKTPFTSGRAALFSVKDHRKIIDVVRACHYVILVWPLVTGSSYHLYGYLTAETGVRSLRLWSRDDGALETCYKIEHRFFNTDWLPFYRKNLYDWIWN